jgi:hypothetical protein
MDERTMVRIVAAEAILEPVGQLRKWGRISETAESNERGVTGEV